MKFFVRLLVATALMLPALALGAAPAEAVESGLGCIEGELTGDQCLISVEPTPGTAECPVSNTTFEDETGCYSVEPAQLTCESPAVLTDQDSCRTTTDVIPEQLVCPDGYSSFGGFDDFPFCDAAPTGCPAGSFFSDIDLECVAPAPQEVGCPFGYDLIEDQCLQFADPDCPEPGVYIGAGVCEAVSSSGACPVPYQDSGIGTCEAPLSCPGDYFYNGIGCESFIEAVFICPSGFEYDEIEFGCIQFVGEGECPPPGFALFGQCESEYDADGLCPEGYEDFGGFCGGPPSTCPGDSVALMEGCGFYAQPIDTTCPDGYVLEFDFCVSFVDGTCPPPGQDVGGFCEADPLPSNCPALYLPTFGGTCEAAPGCPDGEPAFGGECVVYTPLDAECAAGFFFDPFELACVQFAGDPECPEPGFDIGAGAGFCEAEPNPDGTCPDGYEDFGGFCEGPEATCPDGSQLLLEGCFIVGEEPPGGYCANGFAEFDQCVTSIEATCPAPGTLSDAGVCQAEATGPPVDSGCPAPYVASNGSCFADPSCPAEAQVLYAECYFVTELESVCSAFEIDGQCVDYVDSECPTGGYYLGAGICEAEPVVVPASCPDGFSLLTVIDVDPEIALQCEAFTDGELTCENGSLVGQVCQVPEDLVPGPPSCPEDFALVNGTCIKSTSAQYLCAGKAVTINMLTGDSGQGTNGDDVILGSPGRDFINARGGDDTICAGGGNDIVFGGQGSDAIFGEAGRDMIFGGRGSDVIDGGASNDRLFGGGGNDQMSGASGFDRCWGNSGSDTSDGTCERRWSVAN